MRLLYCHPENLDENMIKSVAVHFNICSYFDVPIQHASNSILKRMGRKYTRDDLLRLFDSIRSIAPEAALRTAAIVGFPGETDKDFKMPLDFINKIRFDHLGVFTYSDADDLPSHKLSEHVPKAVANQRYEGVMSRQAEISFENNRKYVGKIYKTLVEAKHKDNRFTDRTYFQAPEVDGITHITCDDLESGSFASVRITDALEYDLIGEVE